MSLIEVVSNQPERRIGNVSSTMFLATIGFMIRNVQTSSPYYDESLATDFLSMARATPLTSNKQPLLSWKHFRSDAPVGYAVVVSSVYYAFSSAQAPPDYIWAYLESGILPSDNSFTFPLTPLSIFGIVAGAAAAVILAVAIRRTIVRSRTQGGLGRASHRKNDNSTGNVTADAYEDSQRAEEQHREDAALFSGQRGMDHTLSGGPGDGSKVSRQWRGDPRRATVALNKETINRDVPILLYSGQQSHSPVRSEEVRLDIDAFLEENGYKPQQQSSDGNDGPKRHVHRVTAVEARLQRAAVAAGLASSAGKEGDMVAAVDPLDDPFQHVVYPVWSQNRPGAFRPPSKFKDDAYRDL
ncbi:transmembrane protein, putative [Bodo saltans]|uniref:Transmembrane protein, putative n=1 Tax=Bodo saltans TaxID=75058 RepID=A0A0S4JNA6_BODSA|nr:transmembrane protein, putative [Bodo saltans]|eukprot:CUG91702.1 transmembrane protein, putative [Bodo saltans]